MSTHQPETFTTTLASEIEGTTYQYLLTVDTRGLVHKVESPFFDLPAAAQRLIMEGASAEITDKIKNRGALFQYEILLALAGNAKGVPAQILAVAQRINQLLKDRGVQWKKLPSVNSRFDVVDWFKVGVAKSKTPDEGSSLKQFVFNLMMLLQTLEGQKKQHTKLNEAFRSFGYYGGPMGHDLLILLIPFHQGNARRILLEGLIHEQREENKLALLRQLALSGNPQWVSGALKALEKYSDPKVIGACIYLFNREEQLSEDALANLARIFKQSPENPQVIEILHTIVRKRKRHSANSATHVLARIPGQQKIMLEEALPILWGKDRTAVEGAFPVLMALDAANLPDGDTIWDIYLSALNLGPNLNIAYSMPSILEKVTVPDLPEKIYAALDHPAAGVRRSTLVIITCSFNKLNHRKRYLELNAPIIEKIFQLFADQDQDTSREAVGIVAKLDRKNLPKHIIQDMVKLYQAAVTNNRFHLRLEVLRVIDTLFKKLTYDPEVESICLTALSDNNHNIRVAAVNVLLRSDNAQVKQRLQEMSNDPQVEVRQALKRKKESILGMDPDIFTKFLSNDSFRDNFLEELEQKRQREKLDKKPIKEAPSFMDRLRKLFRK